VLSGSCVPGEEDLLAQFEDDTDLIQIQRAGEIEIGIAEDSPPIAFVDGSTDEPQGFAVELGKVIAAELGVEARFVPVDPNELPKLVSSERLGGGEFARGELDMGFPLFAVTQTRLQVNAVELSYEFTDPYFVAHQRLLVPADSGVRQIGDLAGKTVCSLIDPATEIRLDEIEPSIESIDVERPEECARALKRGEADAATASDVVLMNVLVQLEEQGRTGDFELAGDDITTEGLGAITRKGASLAAFVDRVLADSEDEGRWTTAFETWIEPYTDAPAEPSDLTLEDAAALFPSDAE
jgi:glutamate transport system substrate-binding protein